MRLRDVWRTTTFRLSALYGVVFVLAVAALLLVVYSQTAAYLNRRVDGILLAETASLSRAPARTLPGRIADAVALNGGQTNIFALFSSDHQRIAGNLPAWPEGLRADGRSMEIPPFTGFTAYARLKARLLPSGRTLVVGRDVNLLREVRAIVASALAWSGAAVMALGLGIGVALSVEPLRRLGEMRLAAQAIAEGDFKRRMPISARRDELDMVAALVNGMVSQVERLMGEVKASTDTIAHDLRTPLTRVRSQLYRLQQAGGAEPFDLARLAGELDEVLERFRALLRISELEARERSAAFALVALAPLVERVVELYAPVAEDAGTALTVDIAGDPRIQGDEKLLFEALSNLVDNALKFTPPGGRVLVAARSAPDGPRLLVEDNGPGVDPDEREAITGRFHRGARTRMQPGSGLGLSIVAAIVTLHGLRLEFEDAGPGLRAMIRSAPTSRV